ncbi:haloacid dehalogenase type II [Lutibaculum baratangense]|uniref:(S)-2-haloacid dehalogenase n=1 Tax=Lutibaculum baratangense AMV1 TaxID=631454 RepID=V4RGY1_9HYPH|nr:haloacid dehalogenase type II [Lutibaculum baratangense]ESR24629.1 haloacid dehalogenase, type II [Lutibaculum baratangense AMV1]
MPEAATPTGDAPRAVAFDIIETVFSLDVLRDRVEALEVSRELVDLWFARSLRDAFALAATGSFAPFRDVLEAALREALAEKGHRFDPESVANVLGGFSVLDPHPDAPEAFRMAREADMRVVALSNGSADVTGALLERALLDEFVDLVISVDEVGLAKPRAEVYRHAAERAGVEPSRLCLVAAHPWDIHGAKAAGLVGAFVSRGTSYPDFMLQPDVDASSLVEAVSALVRR